MKIFNKGLIFPPPLHFYIHWRSSIRVYSTSDDDDDDDDADDADDDDDDDASPVVIAGPGKAQAFADIPWPCSFAVSCIYIYVYIYYIYIHTCITKSYLSVVKKNTRKILTRPFSMDRTTTSVADKQLYRLWSVWIWCRAYKRSLTVANRCNKSRLHPRMTVKTWNRVCNTYYIYVYIQTYYLAGSFSVPQLYIPGSARHAPRRKLRKTWNNYIYFTYNSAYFRHTISEDKWCAHTHHVQP